MTNDNWNPEVGSPGVWSKYPRLPSSPGSLANGPVCDRRMHLGEPICGFLPRRLGNLEDDNDGFSG